jgi:DNA-binding response OmpR family regulator
MEESLYGFGDELGSNAVEVLMHRLRKKLAAASADIVIHTLRGIGYMLPGSPS